MTDEDFAEEEFYDKFEYYPFMVFGYWRFKNGKSKV